tara:strand:+ start:205381 stop:205731 length:351 start_codon:yes stop_codon:yes gene_type:complete
MVSIRLYGIPNCDTVKKAKTFLDNAGVDYEFVNFKKVPPTLKLIKDWEKSLGDLPVNKRGTTFRKIKIDFEEASLDKKRKILVENSSAIKRPVLEVDGKAIEIGFQKEDWQNLKLS